MTGIREGRNRERTRSLLGPAETVSQVNEETHPLYRATQGSQGMIAQWGLGRADEWSQVNESCAGAIVHRCGGILQHGL